MSSVFMAVHHGHGLCGYSFRKFSIAMKVCDLQCKTDIFKHVTEECKLWIVTKLKDVPALCYEHNQNIHQPHNKSYPPVMVKCTNINTQ